MALSESVNTSLSTAQDSLKTALAYSARQEDPYVSVEIAKVIQIIDGIMKADKFQDKMRGELKTPIWY